MEKINLFIVNTDIYYLNNLRGYILKKYSDKFNLVCISDMTLLDNEFRQVESGVLLVSDDIYTFNLKSFKFEEIVILSEKENLGNKDGNKIINKYVAADLLCEDIISIYSNSKNNRSNQEKSKKIETSVISVFSPIGGVGTSSIASSLAILFAKLGEKVLYINLERIKSTDYFFKTKYYSDVEFDQDDKVPFIGMIQDELFWDEKTGVYCFDYAYEDSIIDIKNIIDYIVETKLFVKIIIDIDSNITKVQRSIVSSCDKVLIPVLNEVVAIYKLELYEQNYGFSDNTIFIVNKYRKENEISSKLKSRNINPNYIEYDSKLINGKYSRTYEATKFMNSISEISKVF
ncbi:MAG: hypothetical protein ACRCWG_13625 [Sarcina sp.]